VLGNSLFKGGQLCQKYTRFGQDLLIGIGSLSQISEKLGFKAVYLREKIANRYKEAYNR